MNKINRKGLTLIEIVVSLAILGIIGVMLYPALTGQYSLLHKTRVMTEDLYSAQQVIEVEINDVKTAIQNGETIELSRSYYDIFSGTSHERTVGGYSRKINVHVDSDVINLNAVIADSQLSAFPVSTIDSATIWLANSFNELDFAYWETNDLLVRSDYSDPEPADINMYNICRWYVSRAGFNSPAIADPLEIELGTLYPRFPDDYSVISNYLLSDLNTIREEYAGRHIIFSVTPVSTDYKMGQTVVSNSVFLNGLPYTDNLALHLDASMIEIEDSSVIRESSDRYYVQRWRDISGNENDAFQWSTGDQPELVSVKIADVDIGGIVYETHVRMIRFDGSQAMTISDDASIDLDNMTLIIVAKSSQTTPGKTMLSKLSSNRGWFYGWDDSGSLSYSIERYGSLNEVSAGSGVGLDNEWHILTATASTTTGLVTLQIDSNEPVETTRTILSSITNGEPIRIGSAGGSDYSTFDLAEVILYNNVLPEDDLYDVYTYLENKYNPTPAEISIYSLKPFVDSVVVGEPYSLPSALTAFMSDGSARQVAVTWSPTSTVNTSTPGTYNYTATAVSNPSKTTTGQVTVTGITSLLDDSVSVEHNEAYTLPSNATALLSNGSTRDVAVDWYDSTGSTPVSSTVDTSITGITLFIGKATLDPTKQMTMTVTVTPKTVTGVSLNIHDQTMSIGSTLQLVATVSPDDAYNKAVNWSSSNESIATVSSAGLVQAVGGGSATITATTEDGGFTDTCTILVNTNVTGVTLDLTEKTLRRGTSFQLNETVLPVNATNKNVTWTSSREWVATVSSSGVVVASNSSSAVGRSTVITVTTEDGGYTANCLVTVGNPVTGISISPSTLSLMVGQSSNLNAYIQPSNATNTNIIWTSSDPTIATVNNAGLVTGIGTGNATITAATEDGGFTDTCEVTVTSWRALSISGDGDDFTLVFSTEISSGTLSGSTCSVDWRNPDQLDCSLNGWGNYPTDTDLTVSVQATNGEVKQIVVQLHESGWWWWTYYTWEIISQS